MLSSAKIESARHKIRDIIASDKIEGFIVGITVDPTGRENSYRREQFTGFALVSVCTDNVEASMLEKAMWETPSSAEDDWDKKKHEKMRGSYRPSLGGRLPDAADRYFLYIAWW